MRGDLNAPRSAVVSDVWKHISLGAAQISNEEIANQFHVDSVPEFKNGKKTAKQIIDEFLHQID